MGRIFYVFALMIVIMMYVPEAISFDPNHEICQKYASCGCQGYDDCMADAAGNAELDIPGVRECLMASSCESLCMGQPDGCTGGQAPSGGATSGVEIPGDQSATPCSQIPCEIDGHCPPNCGSCNEWTKTCYDF